MNRLLLQGSYGLESQGGRYLLHKGSWKVRESQGKSYNLKIFALKVKENKVSRSTFGFQNCLP